MSKVVRFPDRLEREARQHRAAVNQTMLSESDVRERLRQGWRLVAIRDQGRDVTKLVYP